MKSSRLTALLFVFLFFCASAQATVTFEIDAAMVENSSSVGVPDGSALFLVATNNGTFALPTAGTITVGSVWGGSVHDVVVAAFGANGNTNFDAPGAIQEVISNLDYASFPTIAAGDDVGLYWFPTDTFSGGGTILSAGNAYGYFNTLSSGSDAAAWILPPDQTSTHSLEFATADAHTASGGAFPNGNDVATFGTVAISVPEPSTYALLGGVTGLAMALTYRRKTSAPVVA